MRRDMNIAIQMKSYAMYLLIKMEKHFPETAVPQHAIRLPHPTPLPVGIIKNELCGTAGGFTLP